MVGWNVFQADQRRFVFASSGTQGYVDIDPTLANGVLASLDQYTPLIDESSIDLERVFEPASDVGFVRSRDAEGNFLTEPTKLEVQYVVKGGDTITGIADTFGLHVATIAERNNISIDEIENIKPGDTLIIPPADTSDSSEWLVKLNQKKESERQRALAQAEAARKSAHAKNTIRNRVAGNFEGSVGTNFIVPINHNGISRGVSRFHAGIDYRAPVGTAVKAGQAGRVIETTGGWAGGFGTSILVDHGGGVTSRYAHLSEIDVSPGQTVNQGDVIGRSGNTGYSTGPHLHFEVRRHGQVVSPF